MAKTQRLSSLLGAAAVFATAAGLATSAAAGPKVGRPAPDFTVTTFGGRTVTSADLKGDVVILNFWATWCGPCKKELPELEGYLRAYSKYGFQVLAVATEGSVPERQLQPLARELTIPLIKRMKGPYGVMDGVPTNYIIDRSGMLVYAKAAALDIPTLDRIVFPLLKQPIPPDTPAPAAGPARSGPQTQPAAADAGTKPAG